MQNDNRSCSKRAGNWKITGETPRIRLAHVPQHPDEKPHRPQALHPPCSLPAVHAGSGGRWGGKALIPAVQLLVSLPFACLGWAGVIWLPCTCVRLCVETRGGKPNRTRELLVAPDPPFSFDLVPAFLCCSTPPLLVFFLFPLDPR